MGFAFVGGAYNRAVGTRAAFEGLSADLEREGHPAMVSHSGDREPADQLAIWYQRMVPKHQVNGRKVYGTKWWQGQTWYQIHPDSVGIPETSNHEKRRSNDLKWPYNSDTAAHRRAKQLAPRHGITCEGENWTFWGALGEVGTPAGGGSATPLPEPIGDEAMYIKALSDGAWARKGVIYTNDVGGHWRGMTNLEGNGYVLPLAREGRIRLVEFAGTDLDLLFALNGVWEQSTVDSNTAPRWGSGTPLMGLGVMTGKVMYPGSTGWQYPTAQPPASTVLVSEEDA